MKRMSKFIIALMLIGLTAFGIAIGDSKQTQSTSPEAPDKIEWLAFDEGLEALEADTLNRHMFIDITAAWCGWCKRMDREAFADSAVIRLVNEHFIPVKLWSDSRKMLDIDGYQISEQNLARSEFKVSGVPVFWFLSPEKMRIGPLRGYQTVDRMTKALEYVKAFEYDTTRTEDDDQGKEKNK